MRSDNITFEGAGTVTSPEIRLSEASLLEGDYVGFKPPLSITSSVMWTLPSSDGTLNQGLATNGSGTLSWVDFITEINLVILEFL